MKIVNQNIQIDGIDKKILRALMKDARTPILEIARSVGISGAAIHQRLRKLEKSGLISGSKFVLNPKVLGYTTMAFIGIFLDKAISNPEAVKQLQKIPEVLECHYTT
ncbi:MAG: Lrp/AsnC family transcriptional regulator for asnA, asnC and gidA, partial [Psychroserpens sp.]